jgi:predicted small metal-binding protein
VKQFACGAVVPGCGAVLRAPTEEGVLAAVAEHARQDHGMDTVPPELVAQVREGIVDA